MDLVPKDKKSPFSRTEIFEITNNNKPKHAINENIEKTFNGAANMFGIVIAAIIPTRIITNPGGISIKIVLILPSFSFIELQYDMAVFYFILFAMLLLTTFSISSLLASFTFCALPNAFSSFWAVFGPMPLISSSPLALTFFSLSLW